MAVVSKVYVILGNLKEMTTPKNDSNSSSKNASNIFITKHSNTEKSKKTKRMETVIAMVIWSCTGPTISNVAFRDVMRE